MTKAPAFQFYAAEYLADENVQLMTLEEEGCYIRLMAYCWREGSIPSDLDKLSRLCKGASTTVLRVVAGCFNQCATDKTRLVHKRLEFERDKQRYWRDKSSNGGRKSAELRAAKKNQQVNTVDPPRVVSAVVSTVVEPPFQPNANTSSSSSSSSSKEQIQKQTPLSDSPEGSPDGDNTQPRSPDELIYELYPRKEGHGAAIKQVQLAVVRLKRGEGGMPPMSAIDARRYLFRRSREYAESPAGRNPDKSKIPHPKTWFSQSRYLDDSSNWQIVNEARAGGSNGSNGFNRSKTDGNIDAARRAIINLTGIDPYEAGAGAPGSGELGDAGAVRAKADAIPI